MNMMKQLCVSESIHLLLFTCLLLFQIHCRAINPFLINCVNSANYTSGSQFETNLNLLLPSLVSNGSCDGFFNTTSGNNSDPVYGLVQCRGDISTDECQSCLNTSSVEIIQRCPNQKGANILFTNCRLRYSNLRFFSQLETSILVYRPNPNNATNVDVFNQQLGKLMSRLSANAASKPSKFETGLINLTNFQDIYGLTECTRDLSETNCLSCLRYMISNIPRWCDGRIGAQIASVSCNIRYELYPFYKSSPSPPLTPIVGFPSPSDTGSSEKSFSNIIVVIVLPTIIAVLFLLSICAYLLRRKVRRETKKVIIDGDGDEIKSAESLQFGLGTIKVATRNFSDANKLGEGGFGAVYKGELPDGQEIAVKRLSRNSGQGSLEFKNEVMLLHKLQHRNLVKLLGFCLEGGEKILIYEYVPNRSLNKYLFDPTKRASLNWEKRYKIIGGIARGLLYLHEDSRLRIIHRDLKASNVLLDGEMNPKIADFGMAKLFGEDQTRGNTSRIAGTFGYMAPEYVLHGLFSVKSDVFSFGVLLLEIVSGQKISSFHQSGPSKDLLSYVWKHWREGTALELMDPTLADSFLTSEVMRSIHIGLLCVQENIDNRPTMSSVVIMLNSNSLALASPSPPAFFYESRTGPSVLSREWKSCQSNESEDSVKVANPTILLTTHPKSPN